LPDAHTPNAEPREKKSAKPPFRPNYFTSSRGSHALTQLAFPPAVDGLSRLILPEHLAPNYPLVDVKMQRENHPAAAVRRFGGKRRHKQALLKLESGSFDSKQMF
jgi:hypothetical protein